MWYGHGNRSNPSGVVEHSTMQQWGTIAHDPRLLLVHIQDTMTVQRYAYDMLRLVALPYLQGVLYAFYQQDNVWPHTSHISQCVLQGLWPVYSPDRSPFEQILGCLLLSFSVCRVASLSGHSLLMLHFQCHVVYIYPKCMEYKTNLWNDWFDLWNNNCRLNAKRSNLYIISNFNEKWHHLPN